MELSNIWPITVRNAAVDPSLPANQATNQPKRATTRTQASDHNDPDIDPHEDFRMQANDPSTA